VGKNEMCLEREQVLVGYTFDVVKDVCVCECGTQDVRVCVCVRKNRYVI